MIQMMDCQYLGEIDGSCSDNTCWAYKHGGPRCEMKDVPTPVITRIDDYNIEVNGTRVVAGLVVEARIRKMTPSQLERFSRIFLG